MPETVLIASLVSALQVGSLYALMALGITLTVSVIKLPNFAHAEFVTVGAFAALLASRTPGFTPLIVLLIAGIAGAVAAFLSHQMVFRSLEKQRASTYTLLLASFAVGLILRYLLFILADSGNLFDQRVQITQQIVYRNGALIITNIFLWVVPTSLLLVVLLSLLLNRTALGRQMRALANNRDLARIIGIRVARVKNGTWLLVGVLAGVAGALWGMYSTVSPLTGWTAILSVFAAATLGGLSSFTGTIIGAYVVALSENTVMQFLNFQFGLDFSFKPAIPFVIIILVLLFRPQGFTGLFDGFRRRAVER